MRAKRAANSLNRYKRVKFYRSESDTAIESTEWKNVRDVSWLFLSDSMRFPKRALWEVFSIASAPFSGHSCSYGAWESRFQIFVVPRNAFPQSYQRWFSDSRKPGACVALAKACCICTLCDVHWWKASLGDLGSLPFFTYFFNIILLVFVYLYSDSQVMLLMYIAAVTGMELIKVEPDLPVDHPWLEPRSVAPSWHRQMVAEWWTTRKELNTWTKRLKKHLSLRYNAAAAFCFRDTMDAILTLLQVFSALTAHWIARKDNARAAVDLMNQDNKIQTIPQMKS